MKPHHGMIVLLVALCAAVSTTSAATLGRLFTTPGERARLDQGRDARSGAEAAPTSRFTFNGYMLGSDGRRAVWINGRRSGPGVRLHNDGRALLQGHRHVPLKAGQTLEAGTGHVIEAFDKGQAAGHPDRS